MGEVQAAMEAYQQVMLQFGAAEKHTMSASLKIFRLMRLLPLELAKDFLRQSGKFQGEYAEARRWILDQIVVRKDDGAGRSTAFQIDTGDQGDAGANEERARRSQAKASRTTRR